MYRFVCAALLLLSSCGESIYDSAKPGKFEGSLLVMWAGPGDPDSGAGQFVYVPTDGQGKALSFKRPGSEADDGAEQLVTIKPEWMYTDGGSIPRAFQAFRGLNPWGYAPAFMVHDWVFVARKCLNAEMANETEAKTKDLTFKDSYVIMAEAIKALEATYDVSESDLPPRAISWAVSLGISRNIWEDGVDCKESKPTEEQIKRVKARLGIGPESTAKAVPLGGELVVPADIVARFDF